jgi:glycolate oxidase
MNQTELELAYHSVAERCLELGARDVFLSDTDERNESLWAARGAFLEAIKASTDEMDECDVVVPRIHVAEFVTYAGSLQKKYQVRIRSFGHAGDGNLHIYILRDGLGQAEWEKRLSAVFADLYGRAKEMGGQVSGEHGIGYAKKPYLCDSLSPDAVGLMRGIKQAFDPKNLLNPGKVIG